MLRVGIFIVTVVTTLCAWQWSTSSGAPADDTESLWVVHYRPKEHGDTAYADILKHLPGDAHLVVAVSTLGDADRFGALAHGRAIDSVEIAARLTPWARDRYLLFRRGNHIVCAAKPWYDLPVHYQGDARVPEELGSLADSLVLVQSPITPIGGDVIVTDERVLVGEVSVEEGLRRTSLTTSELLHEYEQLFGRKAFIVPTNRVGMTRLHLDLIVAWAGGKTLLITDPTLAMSSGQDVDHPVFGHFSQRRNASIARGLDQVAESLVGLGYTVRRIPGMMSELHGEANAPTVITYTNCVVHGDRVLIPHYGLADLDRKAEAAWTSLGFSCAPIRCEQVILGGGAVRCLTNRVR